MKEPNALNDVAEFHRTFDLPVLEKPQMPGMKRRKLRINLLEEELEELKQAVDEEDLEAISDALCDLQYVLSGAVLEFGLGNKFKALFDEVQRSNMSKVCNTRAEAEETQRIYDRVEGVQSRVSSKNENCFLVHRISDGKVLKSMQYSPPDLKRILNCAE